jgi:hypothetical protein
LIDVSEEHVASIYGVEEYIKHGSSMKQVALPGITFDHEDVGYMFFRNIG